MGVRERSAPLSASNVAAAPHPPEVPASSRMKPMGGLDLVQVHEMAQFHWSCWLVYFARCETNSTGGVSFTPPDYNVGSRGRQALGPSARKAASRTPAPRGGAHRAPLISRDFRAKHGLLGIVWLSSGGWSIVPPCSVACECAANVQAPPGIALAVSCWCADHSRSKHRSWRPNAVVA